MAFGLGSDEDLGLVKFNEFGIFIVRVFLGVQIHRPGLRFCLLLRCRHLALVGVHPGPQWPRLSTRYLCPKKN